MTRTTWEDIALLERHNKGKEEYLEGEEGREQRCATHFTNIIHTCVRSNML